MDPGESWFSINANALVPGERPGVRKYFPQNILELIQPIQLYL